MTARKSETKPTVMPDERSIESSLAERLLRGGETTQRYRPQHDQDPADDSEPGAITEPAEMGCVDASKK